MSKWRRHGLRNVHMVKTNVFLFMFQSEEGRDLLMEEGPYIFYRRPFILAP